MRLLRGIRRRASSCIPGSVACQFEPLEPRVLLAAVFWDGGGDGVSWEDNRNWSANALPTAADDVTIDGPLPFGEEFVRFASGTTAIRTLFLDDARLRIEGGTLDIASSATIATNGELAMQGGVLTGASFIEVRGLMEFTGGRVDGNGPGANLHHRFGGRIETSGTVSVWNRNVSIFSDGVADWNATSTFLNNSEIIAAGPLNMNPSGFATIEPTQNGGGVRLTDTGSLFKNGTGTMTIEVPFETTALSNPVVSEGTLDLRGGSPSTSTAWTVDAGGTLAFSGGVFDYDASTIIAGPGSLMFDRSFFTPNGATFTLDGSIALGGTLRAEGGSVLLNGSVDVTGEAVFTNAFDDLDVTINASMNASAVRIFNTASLTVDSPQTWSVLEVSGNELRDSLDGSGDITVTGLLEWARGCIVGTGDLIAGSTASVNMAPGFGFRDLDRRLINHGSMDLPLEIPGAGGGELVLRPNGMVINETSGIMTANGLLVRGETGSRIENRGVFIKTGTGDFRTAGISGVPSPPIINDGRLDVLSGRLSGRVSGGGEFNISVLAELTIVFGTISGGATFNGDGLLRLGTVDMPSGLVEIDVDAIFDGTLDGGADIEFARELRYQRAVMGGTGVTRMLPGSRLELEFGGGLTSRVLSRTLEVHGEAEWTSVTTEINGGSLHIFDTGSLALRRSVEAFTGDGMIINEGTINQAGGVTVVDPFEIVIDVMLENRGTFFVGYDMALTRGSSLEGSVEVAGTRTLRLAGLPTHELKGEIVNGGVVELAGLDLVVDHGTGAPSAISGDAIIDGVIAAPQGLDFNGIVEWRSGLVFGGDVRFLIGADVTIAVEANINATLQILGNATLTDGSVIDAVQTVNDGNLIVREAPLHTTIAGGLVNNGVLTIDAGGELRVVLGEFTQSAFGILRVKAAGPMPDDYGRLIVDIAMLDGSLLVDLRAYDPQRADSLEVITTINPVVGSFQSVSLSSPLPPELKPIAIYGNSVNFVITSVADLDENGIVEVFDLLLYLGDWFGASPDADTDGNGLIEVFDLLAFLEIWFIG